MVPGNGIIVKTDPSAASGASVSDYHLGGYQTSAVMHPSAWTVSDLQVGFLVWPDAACVRVCADTGVLHLRQRPPLPGQEQRKQHGKGNKPTGSNRRPAGAQRLHALHESRRHSLV